MLTLTVNLFVTVLFNPSQSFPCKLCLFCPLWVCVCVNGVWPVMDCWPTQVLSCFLFKSLLQINTNTAFMHLGINWQLCGANMVGNTPSYTSSMRVLLCTSLCYHKRIHEHPTQQKQWSPGSHTAIDLNVMDKPLNKLGQVCCIGDWQNFQFQWSIFWNQVSFSVQLAQSTHRANRAADGQQRGCNRGQPCGSTTRRTCWPPGWGLEGVFISSKHCEVPVTPQC